MDNSNRKPRIAFTFGRNPASGDEFRVPETCRVAAAEAKMDRTVECFRLNERLEGLAVLGKLDEIYLHIVGNLCNSGI